MSVGKEMDMKRATATLAVIGLATSPLLWAADTPEAVADRMLDPTRNASAFKDPHAFVQWTGDRRNPAVSLALAQKGMDPNSLQDGRLMYIKQAGGISPINIPDEPQLKLQCKLEAEYASGWLKNIMAFA
jgi:hypothetical protein